MDFPWQLGWSVSLLVLKGFTLALLVAGLRAGLVSWECLGFPIIEVGVREVVVFLEIRAALVAGAGVNVFLRDAAGFFSNFVADDGLEDDGVGVVREIKEFFVLGEVINGNGDKVFNF